MHQAEGRVGEGHPGQRGQVQGVQADRDDQGYAAGSDRRRNVPGADGRPDAEGQEQDRLDAHRNGHRARNVATRPTDTGRSQRTGVTASAM